MRFDEHGHILITPSEIQASSFSDPDTLISHWLLPGTAIAFPMYEQYLRFLAYLNAFLLP
jgi:hypothetical protein